MTYHAKLKIVFVVFILICGYRLVTFEPEAPDAVISREPIAPPGMIRRFVGHEEPVRCLAFSPDGQQILSGCGAPRIRDNAPRIVKELSIRLWDVSTGKELLRMNGHTEMVNGVAFSPNGQLALSGSEDRTIRVWDLKTGVELRSILAHGTSVNCVGFFKDGIRAYSGGTDRTVRLWNVKTGAEIKKIGPAIRSIRSVALSPDERLLVAGDGSGEVRLWDIESEKLIQTFTHSNVNSVAYCPNGKYVLSAGSGQQGKSVILWNIKTGEADKIFRGHHCYAVYSSDFSPDGSRILSCGTDSFILQWETLTGRLIGSVAGSRDSLTCIAANQDWTYAVSAGGGMKPQSYDYSIRLWDLDTKPLNQQHVSVE